jgi:hypothetical protein
MRCSEVGWEASSRRDHPAATLQPPSMACSAAASARARPWSAANRSAANSDRRLIAASAKGQKHRRQPDEGQHSPDHPLALE